MSKSDLTYDIVKVYKLNMKIKNGYWKKNCYIN